LARKNENPREGHEETVADLPLTEGLPMKTNVPIKMGMWFEQGVWKILKISIRNSLLKKLF
jgi:hypothetical protein